MDVRACDYCNGLGYIDDGECGDPDCCYPPAVCYDCDGEGYYLDE